MRVYLVAVSILRPFRHWWKNAAAALSLPEDQVEKLSFLLEESGLIEVRYTLGGASLVAKPPSPVRLALASPGSAVEAALFDAANIDRAKFGLPPLQFAPELLSIARERAQAQVGQTGLSHTDESGRLAFAVLFENSGIRYRRAGENLARLGGTEETRGARAEEALMNSPTHRANILQPDFDYLAVGAISDGRGSTSYAQVFLHP